MKLVCMNCGHQFEGDNTKFCSQSCRDSYIMNIEKRVRESVKNDSSHTKELSRDS
ncbi:hypothetical protein [Nitrosarchaeum sp.]|uniref:hypothetical protein n=1 Tax=Nitrosarchaeum sp. TaxID=2026886 RepID=UPI00247E3838|nr:hypothetical protein [Nitrosarchaeum sp.]MCV0412669.1 hypothetical protein [Nitrosarchaeum sp.]